jgi:hypothetical protein
LHTHTHTHTHTQQDGKPLKRLGDKGLVLDGSFRLSSEEMVGEYTRTRTRTPPRGQEEEEEERRRKRKNVLLLDHNQCPELGMNIGI